MENIRFTPTTPGTKFGPELRKKVTEYFKENNLSEKGGWVMILKALMMPAVYIAPLVVIFTVSMPWWFMLLLCIISGAGLAFTGMAVMHDAAHGSLTKVNWVNKLLAGSMYLLGGSVFTWKVQHNVLHHTFTNIEGYDEDIESPYMLRMSRHSRLRAIHRFQHFYALFLYGFLTLSKIIYDFPQALRYLRTGLGKRVGATKGRELAKLIVAKVLYLGAMISLPILFTDFYWWQLLIGFLVLHFTAGFIMATIFQLAHVVEDAEQFNPPANHDMETEWAAHQLRTTANFAPRNGLLTWFIGGLNYQIEHHLFPHISHIHYRKIAPIVEQTAKEYGIPYHRQRTLGGALLSHIRMLKILGRTPAPAVA